MRFTPPICDRCGDPLLSWRETPGGTLIDRRDADHADSGGSGTCRRCAGRTPIVTRSRAIGSYDGSLRAILHAFKYDGCRSLARGLGGRVRESAADLLSAADVVVPVPLHRGRERTRGFNQARALAGELGPPVLDVLRRIRPTPSQTGLPAHARRANVSGAFALRRNTDVAGLRVVLVDDVSTTGATLDACAEVLRAGGASDVSAATAARVASPPGG